MSREQKVAAVEAYLDCFKLAATLTLFFVASAAPLFSFGEPGPKTFLTGQVSMYGITPLSDAVVEFCETANNATGFATGYVPLATTVSDSEGTFILALGQLHPNKTYSVRARANTTRWAAVPLGTGDRENDWGPVKIIVRRTGPSLAPPGVGNGPLASFGEMSVLFATDREIQKVGNVITVTNQNDKGGSLTFGKCEVAVERGDFSDHLLQYFYDRDSEHYYTVQRIEPLSEDTWSQELVTRINTDSSHDALLFIHGYKTSFDEACRRAAQIAYDIKFTGPVLLYSWPSHNAILSYKDDEAMAAWSNPHFQSYLRQVLNTSGLRHVHIIAHSMGNRIVTDTLLGGYLTHQQLAHIGQVILAAPDVDRAGFSQRLLNGNPHAQRITLYASDHDQALWLSGKFNNSLRLGATTPDILTCNGMDSIDASAVDTSLLGHSYIGNERSVLVDVSALVFRDEAPDKRFGVLKVHRANREWWALTP